MNDEFTLYKLVGGDETFQLLVDSFYDRIEQDPLLRPMFPASLEPGKRRQFLFLTQFFGGPPRYNEERGHPRLRLRHGPFPIDEAARRRWLGHMLAAIDEAGIDEPMRSVMRNYFDRASAMLVNRAGPVDEDAPEQG
ncbi:MAG: globin [Anaerolineaceae bacterium]|nr:globin [Anaerolineaceae bacterium]